MARWKPLGARLALLVACVALSYVPSLHPIYDGMPNTGDESMSLSQAMNCFRQRSPGYGYTGAGKPWTAGQVILPGFFVVYGPAMALAPPFKRIPLARTISRALVGTALFFGLLLLWRARRRRPSRTRLEEAGIGLCAAGLIALFVGTEPFVYVGSFGRIDALGLWALCAYQWGAAAFLDERHQRSLLAVGLLALLALSMDSLAGALCVLDALALGLFHLVRPFSWAKARRTALMVGVVAAVAAALFLVVNHLWLSLSPDSTPNVALRREMSFVTARLFHWGDGTWLHTLRAFRGLTACMLLAAGCALAALVGKGRRETFVLLLARLAMVWLAARVFMVAERFTYAPMLLAAVLLPLLDVVVREGARPLLTMVGVALPSVVLLTFGLPRFGADDERRLEVNTYRDAHLRSVTDYLNQSNVRAAIVDDPLFTLLDGDRRYYFIYENDPTPEEEYRTLVRFVEQFDAEYLVSDEFGRTGWLQPLGFPVLKKAMRETEWQLEPVEVSYPGGRKLRLRKLFHSVARPLAWGGRVEYVCGDRPSTPFTVFRVEVVH